jgi:hypothetical protein
LRKKLDVLNGIDSHKIDPGNEFRVQVFPVAFLLNATGNIFSHAILHVAKLSLAKLFENLWIISLQLEHGMRSHSLQMFQYKLLDLIKLCDRIKTRLTDVVYP